MIAGLATGNEPKRRRRKTKAATDQDILVVLDDGPRSQPHVNPVSGAVTMYEPDGSVVVDFNPKREPRETKNHDENLAEIIDPIELGGLCEEILDGIQADDMQRKDYLTQRERGLDLLGLKIDEARTVSSGSSVAMSGVRHPLLLEAVLNFQANARGEMLPSRGPVKIASDGNLEADVLAEGLEKDMNTFLTKVASEYVPDTDQMLFMLGFGGMSFKKLYRCPLKQRPVILSVDAADIILSDYSSGVDGCLRVTHTTEMTPTEMKRRQYEGYYRDIDLDQQILLANPVQTKTNLIQGVTPNQSRPADYNHQLYECYCDLNIKGFEHRARKGRGKITGLPLPYRVTIDVASRQILEIRRNWREGDFTYTKRKTFVPYVFIPGIRKTLAIGLLHILGNSTSALTSAWRLMLDNSMFANFPGFLFAKSSGRQLTNDFRVPPGGGVAVDVPVGNSIQNSIMPLPYKEVGPAMMKLVEEIAQNGRQTAGAAQMQISEGNQEAPVGTTLALIEQALKIMNSVHKRLHAAQAEEFSVLRDLFMEYPEDLLKTVKAAKRRWRNPEALKTALEMYDLAPHADPNTPSHMHRLMKATAVMQIDQAKPGLFEPRSLATYVLHMIGVDNPEAMYAPPAPPPQQPGPDPIATGALQLKAKELEVKQMIEQAKIADRAKDRASKERLQTMEIAERLATHPESAGVVAAALGKNKARMQ
ncbi:MAG: hypothetical protein KAX87_03105 [Nitrospira sp.]|nr:hypothetical protein [Nitrospira sp.]